MPHLLDTDSRTSELVAAINHILAMHGPTGLSLRRIAQVSGVSTSSMLHHLGSREHLLRVAAGRTAATRQGDLEARVWVEGALALLPQMPDHVVEARVWLAWLEMWRSEGFLEKWIVEARARERSLLARVVDYRLTRDELDAAVALVDGLTVAVCAPTQPMRLDRARLLFARHLVRLGVNPQPSDDVTPPLHDGSSW